MLLRIHVLALAVCTATAHGLRGASKPHECVHSKVIKKRTPRVVPQPERRAGPQQQRQGLRIRYFFPNSCPTEVNASDGGTTVVNASCYCTEVGQQVTNGDTDTAEQNPLVTCTEQDLFVGERRQYVTNLLDEVVAWFNKALLVDPAPNNRITLSSSSYVKVGETSATLESKERCGAAVPPEHLTSGVADADFILYVTLAPIRTSTLAWAWGCILDQREKPIVGHTNVDVLHFDPATLAGSLQYRNHMGVLIHETMHALGFSNFFWDTRSTWFDTHCDALGRTSCSPTEVSMERGGNVTKIVTPEVVKKMREYAGCDSLTGAEIENQGSAGSVGSHWEKRAFGNELMTSSLGAIESECSVLTLAYFKDTGHYDVDYSQAAADYTWGKHKGCSFWKDKCSEISPASLRYPEYCFPSDLENEVMGCDYHLTSPAGCDARTNLTVPLHFRHFPDDPSGGGADTYTDFCPTWTSHLYDTAGTTRMSCVESRDDTGLIWTGVNDSMLGISRSSASRCFIANIRSTSLSVEGANVLSADVVPVLGHTRCFQVKCATNCLSYELTVQHPDGTEFLLTCSGGSEPVYPTAWTEKWAADTAGGRPHIECWPVEDICGYAARAELPRCADPPTISPTAPSTASPVSPTGSPSQTQGTSGSGNGGVVLAWTATVAVVAAFAFAF